MVYLASTILGIAASADKEEEGGGKRVGGGSYPWYQDSNPRPIALHTVHDLYLGTVWMYL